MYPFGESKKKKLIIHCCHHKTGTFAMHFILKSVCNELGLKYQYCAQKKLKDDTDVWFENHSFIDFKKINRPIIGSHMIRHPCSIILSAYEYHKKTVEPWANKKLKNFGDYSYKEILNKLSDEEGLAFEIRNKIYTESSRNTINDIYNWDYNRENFLEFKYENLLNDFDTTIRNIFKHYGFSGDKLKKIIEIANKHNLRKSSAKDIKKNKHVTNLNFDTNKWMKYFNNEEIINLFYKCYPKDIFEKLSYLEVPSVRKDTTQIEIENLINQKNELLNKIKLLEEKDSKNKEENKRKNKNNEKSKNEEKDLDLDQIKYNIKESKIDVEKLLNVKNLEEEDRNTIKEKDLNFNQELKEESFNKNFNQELKEENLNINQEFKEENLNINQELKEEYHFYNNKNTISKNQILDVLSKKGENLNIDRIQNDFLFNSKI